MKYFSNKIVFITGGSAGIGLETAKLFALKGAHIMIFARRIEILKKAAASIEAFCINKNQKVSWESLDVGRYDDVKNKMNKAVEDFGSPDVLVNCAGRAYPRYFEDISYNQFDETMKINLYGMWNTISVLLPYMKEQGGHIVNVSSVAGFVGVFGYTDYCASKFGIIGFSEALRSEVRKYGIGISVLCPPDTDTPGFEIENQTKPEETKAISASASLMSPEKVARTVLNGIKKGKFIIIPGLDGKFTYFMKRLFPWVVTFVMNHSIKKVQKQQGV